LRLKINKNSQRNIYSMQTIKGKMVDIIQRDIYNAILSIKDGKIKNIQKTEEEFDHYLLPGFIDSHVHIESSMLKLSEFARMAVKHGTVAVISDPHEIANVIDLMVENIPMLSGRFLLTVAIHSREHNPYDWHDKLYHFDVIPTSRDAGMFDLPCKWII
jgi:adenine deaminase